MLSVQEQPTEKLWSPHCSGSRSTKRVPNWVTFIVPRHSSVISHCFSLYLHLYPNLNEEIRPYNESVKSKRHVTESGSLIYTTQELSSSISSGMSKILELLAETNKLWILLGIFIFARLVSYSRLAFKGKLPPGPRGLPIVGNIFQVSTEAWNEFAQWKKEFGEWLFGSIFRPILIQNPLL